MDHGSAGALPILSLWPTIARTGSFIRRQNSRLAAFEPVAGIRLRIAGMHGCGLALTLAEGGQVERDSVEWRGFACSWCHLVLPIKGCSKAVPMASC